MAQLLVLLDAVGFACTQRLRGCTEPKLRFLCVRSLMCPMGLDCSIQKLWSCRVLCTAATDILLSLFTQVLDVQRTCSEF